MPSILGSKAKNDPIKSIKHCLVMEAFLTHPFREFRVHRRRDGLLAFTVAVLIHLAVVLLLPERLMPAHRVAKQQESVVYEIDLVEPEDRRFVEANPEVPENEPDQTKQYSFRAQQAADQNPLSTADNRPQVEGEEASQKIRQGQLEQVSPLLPGVYTPEVLSGKGGGNEGSEPGSQAPPDFIQQKPVAEEGPGSRSEITANAPEVAPDPVPDAPINVYRPSKETEARIPFGDGAEGQSEARPMPRARPRLAPELLSGPLMQSKSSARRRGDLAIDATFSKFGEYQQQFYAAVQAGWYQEIEFFEPLDTASRVHVRFRIKADGSVDSVEAVQTTASRLATVICVTAITKRSPFRPWTEEMVEVFGKERWLNVVFHYR